MTDNEIIKAFKDFLNEQADGYTDHVETGGERYEFVEKELELLKETDNLINRLQAEIERLNKEVDRLSQCVLYHDGQIVDAVKEFAERLKDMHKHNTTSVVSLVAVFDNINNLVKEMERK